MRSQGSRSQKPCGPPARDVRMQVTDAEVKYQNKTVTRMRGLEARSRAATPSPGDR